MTLFAGARTVADAVLYEGYVLYPYRASSRKNQIRWQFGVLAPRPWAEADGSERWANRTEVLVDPGQSPILHVTIRCLQVQERTVERVNAAGAWEPAGAIEIDGVRHVDFAEAVEREVSLQPISLLPLSGAAASVPIVFEAATSSEAVTGGRILRVCQRVEGHVDVQADWAAGPGALVKVAVGVTNDGDLACGDRDTAMQRSLVSVHALLAIEDGEFVSLLDPPEFAAEAAAGCHSDGTYPVLVGEEGNQTATVVLSSPIILYDHPAVAPESQGDMFDATEIDEILALRVLTLTDEEKAEARGTDRRAAAIVDRCDDMPPEMWARLHGAVRSISPAAAEPAVSPWWDPGSEEGIDPFADTTIVAGRPVGRGAGVVLRPSRRADAHDLFLAGQPATVAGVFRDLEGAEHVAVTLDDDPAADLLGSTGRFYYFAPDELELR